MSDLFEMFFKISFRNNFDDTDDAITRRITQYNEKTKPVAAKFNAKTLVMEATADEIFVEVQKIMDAM